MKGLWVVVLVVLMRVEDDDEHGKGFQVSAGEGRDKDQNKKQWRDFGVEKRWGEIIVVNERKMMLVMVLTEMRSTIEYYGLFVCNEVQAQIWVE